MAASSQTRLSETEYLVWERASEEKHEYRDGEVIAMSGANRAHSLLVSGASYLLSMQLQRRPCELYLSLMRVKLADSRWYVYPDLVVVCDEPQFADAYTDTLLNPTLIIEVVSSATESYGRGEKFHHYRALSSLREYVLFAQDRYRIEQFTRQGELHWLLTVAEGLDASVNLASIDCTLRLADVYKKVVATHGQDATSR